MSVKIDLEKWKFSNEDVANKSIAQILAMQDDEIIMDFWNSLSNEEAKTLKTDWAFWGRPKQFVPESSTIHVLAPGRGFGKTRAVSEWVRSLAEKYPGINIGLVGRTYSDVLNTMVLGQSGIYEVCPEDNKPELKKQEGVLIWRNGSRAKFFSADKPSQLRGPTLHAAAADEMAAWNHVKDESGATAWDNLQMAVREVYRKDGLVHNPQITVATTPKPIEAFKRLYDRAMDPEDTTVTIVQGTSYENSSLPQSFYVNLEKEYGGTDLFDQELMGGLLSEKKGKLWTYELLNKAHYIEGTEVSLDTFIISVDPSVADQPIDECGIIVGGLDSRSDINNRELYVIEDASLKAPPEIWAKKVVEVRSRYPNAIILAERNQGGGLVSSAIRAASDGEIELDIRSVWSKDSKVSRASTALIKYQFNKVRHLDTFTTLENQMVLYNPETVKKSPDRLDALVQLVQYSIITPLSGLFKATPAKVAGVSTSFVNKNHGFRPDPRVQNLVNVRTNPLRSRRKRIW